jgi:hypothetical protein
VGCGMFVWEWSWEWNLQPSKKKTITLLSPSTQKIELGTSSLMISIFNGVYRFIWFILTPKSSGLSHHISHEYCHRSAHPACRPARPRNWLSIRRDSWRVVPRTYKPPACDARSRSEESFQSVLSKNWVPKSSGWWFFTKIQLTSINQLSLVKCPVVIAYQNPVVNQVGVFTDYPYFWDTPKYVCPSWLKWWFQVSTVCHGTWIPCRVQTFKSSLDFFSL